MVLLYIILIVYILAVNFYAFLYMRSLHKTQTEFDPTEVSLRQTPKREKSNEVDLDFPLSGYGKPALEFDEPDEREENTKKKGSANPMNAKPQKFEWQLLLTGALGGAITVYVCMFLYKYKLKNILLMIVMPVLAAINVYFWYLLFSQGFFIKV
ncbi:MAG: hypothetical protein IJW58_04155 [Clostridia bacterium]|nr:hypothetical protein [Clostridia bacterium]